MLEAGARRVVLTRAAFGSQAPAEVIAVVGDRLRRAWLDDASLSHYAFDVFGTGTGRLKP